jgi:hypothetical protein
MNCVRFKRLRLMRTNNTSPTVPMAASQTATGMVPARWEVDTGTASAGAEDDEEAAGLPWETRTAAGVRANGLTGTDGGI